MSQCPFLPSGLLRQEGLQGTDLGSPAHPTLDLGITAALQLAKLHRSHTLSFLPPSWVNMLLWHNGNDAVEPSAQWPLDAQHRLVTLGFTRKSTVSKPFLFLPSFLHSCPPSLPPLFLSPFAEQLMLLFIAIWHCWPSGSIWKTRKTEALHKTQVNKPDARCIRTPKASKAISSISARVSTASGRTEPELGWQGEAEAQKNVRKISRKIHSFLGWDGQCNCAVIWLELQLAIWSLVRSLMSFIRTSGTNWTTDLQNSPGFEGGSVKGFWIIHSSSHLLFFLSLFSTPFYFGGDWSSHAVFRVNFTICRH